jgi:hypothetical protein
MLNNNQFTRNLPPRIVLRMNSVREYGNIGAHDKGPVTMSDAIDCLKCLVEVLDWYSDEYLDEAVSVLPKGKAIPGIAPAGGVEAETGIAFYRKHPKSILLAVCSLIVVAGFLAFSFSKKSQRSVRVLEGQQELSSVKDLLPQFDKLSGQGVSLDIQRTLKIAYSTKLKEAAPSAAITAMFQQGSNPSEPWRPLSDGETLSSANNYRLMFSPDKTAFFYVFQIDSRGKLDWLFPKNTTTPFSTGTNPVHAGVWTHVPGENAAFHLDDNLGVEHLYVIATESAWTDLEEALRKAGTTSSGALPVQAAFNLKTRGVAGTRFVDAPLHESTEKVSKEVRQIITGKEGVLVWEKWFQHVAADQND